MSLKSQDNIYSASCINKSNRSLLNNQKPGVIWFTGLSGSGKSTLSRALELFLFLQGYYCYVLDGDNLRQGLNRDLGFGDADRTENIRRVAEVSKLFVNAGFIVITAFISPFIADRSMARSLFAPNEFLEVFLDTPIDVCERRDTKGLYAKARKGEIPHFTGIDSIYEPSKTADVVIDTSSLSVAACIKMLSHQLILRGFIHEEVDEIQLNLGR